MTYQELTIFGRLRKLNKLGPFGMFQRLVHDWSIDRERKPDDDAPYYTPAQVADKVKKFFHFYAINRRFPILWLLIWAVWASNSLTAEQGIR